MDAGTIARNFFQGVQIFSEEARAARLDASAPIVINSDDDWDRYVAIVIVAYIFILALSRKFSSYLCV